MSGIAAAVDAELDERPSGTCGICWHLQRMPDDERRGAERGLSSKISNDKMASILTANGYPTSKSSVVRHRAHRQRENA